MPTQKIFLEKRHQYAHTEPMKTLLFIIVAIISGCSSSQVVENKQVTSAVESESLKATPPPQAETKIYSGEAAPNSIQATRKNEIPESSLKSSCKTPLGTIPHGGKATGYLKAMVPADEICISDTITCNDGVWKGQAIHPTCKAGK